MFVSGCYMFAVHLCTYDMKKALAAIRRNGVEVATLFDQNHIDNHKNSMVGQNVLMELQQGDRIQVNIDPIILPSRFILNLIVVFRSTSTHSLGFTTRLATT